MRRYTEKVSYTDDPVYASDDSVDSTAEVINADTLGGKPLSDFMTNGKTGNLKYSDVGAASGAYGLGASVNWDYPSANDIQVTGFYACNVDVPSSAYWYGMHIRYDANSAYQYFVHAEQYYCAEKRKINGAWQPWEWVNPPMTLGVEYRTTERWDEHTVYTKLIAFGAMPSDGTSGINHGISGITQVIRCVGQNITAGQTIPSNWDGNYTSIYADKLSIYIYATSDVSANTAYAQLWYTKD